MIESKRFGSKKALIDIDETICFYGEKRAYELAKRRKLTTSSEKFKFF